MIWKTAKFLAPTGLQTQDCPMCSLVAIPTTPLHLPNVAKFLV